MGVGGQPGIGPLLLLLAIAACEPSRGAPSPSNSGGAPDAGASVDVSPCEMLHDCRCAEFGTGSDECRLADEQIGAFSPDRCAK